MAEGVIGRNLTFPIKNANGTSFHGLSLKKATYNTVVMSLGDKITGDVYYQDNTLAVTMQEYIEYTDNGSTVKFHLVNPPTVVKERMAGDNGELKGMTKYSFEFYHPMYMLGNFPFTDVAVTSNQQKYLSENKTFSWIGTLVDFVAKINKNLQGTQWKVVIGSSVSSEDKNKLSEVMSFDKQTIADALKKGYETWEIPYVVDVVKSGEDGYSSGKRFKVQFGLPTTEILVDDGHGNQVPYVFQCGQGVGLKNNSRTPRNNKIVTRLAGYGSETNIQYGYPQIIWTGNQSWDYTINNSSSAANSYPIYDGIVNGQKVRLIKHPFTRNHLMPSIYRDTVNKKVNPYATGYDPTIDIKDYYDADNTYENPIVLDAPCYEIHEFDKIKPELTNRQIVSVEPANQQETSKDFYLMSSFLPWLEKLATQTNIGIERAVLHEMYEQIQTTNSWSEDNDDSQYWFKASFTKDSNYAYVKYESSNINFTATVQYAATVTPEWDDYMDDDGNYRQSYFKVTLPQLDFDVYACAAVTQEMKIYMRSGDCLGCTFPVMVDWDDYKENFYDEDGNFAPNGEQRDLTKYPNSSNEQITLMLQKEIETFGRLMPNIYQTPESGDDFVILGIALPQTYVTAAESRLDDDMKQYMRDNNVYYFDYPLKFDEYFLATHTNILTQMKNNVVVRFNYAGSIYALYIKQMSVKFGQATLPQYDITLTDDVEIVLNQIGQVTNEVSNLRLLMGSGFGGGGEVDADERYLRKDVDDTARGFITLLKGLQVGERFVTGLLGEGGVFRTDSDGTTYIEADKLYIRMKAYFDTVEVKHYLHSGGNRIASKAGINCTRVEFIDSSGNITNDETNVVKYRCYFKAQEDDKTITNDFVVGDLAFCGETNVSTDDVSQHSYWRAVVGKSAEPNSVGEHYIDLSATDCLSDSDVPIAQDDIIQLGNKTDTTRQGAIVEYVGGEDAPAYQIYQGINTYSLVGKNYVRFGYDSQSGGAQAYIGNPDGSTYLWYHRVNGTPQLDIKANVKMTSPYTSQETDLEAFAAAVKANEDDLQSQIDGEIDTWFYEGTPTLSNAPAVDWNTVALKERHLGDLYYDVGTGQTAGFAYRFIKTTSGGVDTYSWQYIEDTAITEALRIASEAKDTADNKRRVFLTIPTPPYDAGDLWANAVYPSNYMGDTDESQHKYNNDLLRCITAKAEGGTFSINDWQLASKYTDNSALLTFLDGYQGTLTQVQEQIDQKAETWYQDADPSTAWTTDDIKAEHVGDIWCDTSANGGKKTYIYQSRTSGGTTTYYWSEQAVPDSVFDEIDGKTAIYTAWGVWDVPTGSPTKRILQVKDLFIPSSDTTQGGTTYKANKVYRCTAVGTFGSTSPTFQEVSYTDDTTVNAIISKYGEILGITPDATGVGEALGKLRKVLGSSTEISGGLVLTNIIYMKDTETTPSVRAGISGLYHSTETGTGYKGYGTAAWFGGGVYNGVPIDKEVSGTSGSYANYAKSLFRFDGSGYVAHGNLTWDKNGNVTIQGYSINATTLQSGGSNVATEAMLANYVTLNSAQTITGLKTFNNKIKIGDVYLEWESANNALKVYKMSGSSVAAVNLYATGGVSAFGLSTSGGGVTLNQPLASINNLNANPTSANKTLVWNGSAWTYGSVGSGAVSSITVGTTNYSPVGGVVTLPEYVTLSTAQTISGLKTMTHGLIVSGRVRNSGDDEGIVITGASNNLCAVSLGSTNEGRIVFYYNKNTEAAYFNYVKNINDTLTSYKILIPHKNGTIALISDVPTNVSQLTNDAGYITSSASITGNAATATKLQTARTIWGQSFDGSGNVTGTIYLTQNTPHYFRDPNTADWRGGIYWGTGGRESMAFVAKNSRTYFMFANDSDIASWDRTTHTTITSPLLYIGTNVGVGTNSPSYKLDVQGTLGVTGATTLSSTLSVAGGITLTTTKRIYFGDSSHYIELNSTGFHFSHGLYSDSFVSAFGASTSSGGITLNQPLASINNLNANPSSSNKTLVWNGSAWTYADLGSGSVGSIVVNGTSYSSVNGVVTLPDYPSDYVTLSTSQTVTGLKTMTHGLIVSGRVRNSGDDEGIVVGMTGSFSALCLGSTSGIRSVFYLHKNASDVYRAFWKFNDGTASYEINHPKKDGTIALISDVPTNNNQLTNGAGYITSSGSCASATKLATPRSIWGQSFDGSANITGTIYLTQNTPHYFRDPNTADWRGGIYWGTGGRESMSFVVVDSNTKFQFVHGSDISTWTGGTHATATSSMTILGSGVGIGTNSPSYKLDVNGTFYASGNSSIGGTLGVIGATTLSSTLSVSSNTTIGGTLGVTGAVTFGGNLSMPSGGRITQGSGNLYLGTSNNSGLVLVQDIASQTGTTYWNIKQTGSATFKSVTIGSAVLSWDSTNSCLKISTGMYSDSFVSAFGASSGGGSLNLNGVLSSINSSSLAAPSATGQTVVWDGSAWQYSTTSNVTLKADKIYAANGITISSGSLSLSNGSISLPGYINAYGNIITNSKIAIGYSSVSSSYQFYCKNNGYISGTLTQGSDIRRKNIIGDVDTLDIDAIAGAPFFKFQWRDSDDNRIYAGTSAQYWQLCLPETVLPTGDGYLSMDYGVTALISTIITARKVVDHEKRIAELEAENEILRQEINELKAA